MIQFYRPKVVQEFVELEGAPKEVVDRWEARRLPTVREIQLGISERIRRSQNGGEAKRKH